MVLVEDTVSSAEATPIIVLMGHAGSGKSSFINAVVGSPVANVGEDIVESETSEIQEYAYFAASYGLEVRLVDTPGFGNTRAELSDSDILRKITEYMEDQRKKGQTLYGIIYVHNVTEDAEKAQLHRKRLPAFKVICGFAQMKSIVVVTTLWDLVDHTTGSDVEQALTHQELLEWLFKPEDGASLARCGRFNDGVPDHLKEAGICTPKAVVDDILSSHPTLCRLEDQNLPTTRGEHVEANASDEQLALAEALDNLESSKNQLWTETKKELIDRQTDQHKLLLSLDQRVQDLAKDKVDAPTLLAKITADTSTSLQKLEGELKASVNSQCRTIFSGLRDELDQKLGDLSTQNARSEEALKAELDTTQEALKKLEKEKAFLDAETKGLRTELESVGDALRAENASLRSQSLETERALRAELDNIQVTLKKVEQERNSLASECRQLRVDMSSLGQDLRREFQDLVQPLLEESRNTKLALEKAEAERTSLLLECSKLRGNFNDLGENMATWSQDLVQRVNQNIGVVDELKKELEGARGELETARKEASDKEGRLEQEKKERETLAKEIETLTTKMKEMQTSITSLKQAHSQTPRTPPQTNDGPGRTEPVAPSRNPPPLPPRSIQPSQRQNGYQTGPPSFPGAGGNDNNWNLLSPTSPHDQGVPPFKFAPPMPTPQTTPPQPPGPHQYVPPFQPFGEPTGPPPSNPYASGGYHGGYGGGYGGGYVGGYGPGGGGTWAN